MARMLCGIGPSLDPPPHSLGPTPHTRNPKLTLTRPNPFHTMPHLRYDGRHASSAFSAPRMEAAAAAAPHDSQLPFIGQPPTEGKPKSPALTLTQRSAGNCTAGSLSPTRAASGRQYNSAS
eukprot:329-Chlamydomonas_euryale.AAC.1